MNSDDVTVDLTEAQASELMDLMHQYDAAIGHNMTDPAVWFGNHVSMYVKALALDATMEAHGFRMRKSIGTRRSSLQACENYLGWAPSARDILGEVSRLVAVPPYIADAIRHAQGRPQSQDGRA